jgi:type VI secretion system protein ImpN
VSAPEAPGLARLAARLADLRRELSAIPDAADRRVALDALRDALDRDAEPAARSEFVAGSFRREGVLHEGEHFEVHRLRHRDAGTLHALKTPAAARACDPALRRLLLNEAVCQARVVHPACLPFRALLRIADGRPALLTDLVAGPTLAVSMGQRPFDEPAALGLARRLAGAVAAVHAAGLVHGDVKPGNILLPGGAPEEAILFDFGLARPVAMPYASDTVERAGTEGFLRPERRRPGALAHPADDLFALGRILAAIAPASAAPLRALALALTQPDRSRCPPTAGDVQACLADCGMAATR